MSGFDSFWEVQSGILIGNVLKYNPVKGTSGFFKVKKYTKKQT
jgi:hypothetical protein